MGNPKKDSKHFRPRHLGMQSLEASGNKGKQMQMKGNKQPDLIQTKGK
ncbi:acid-soluble spore protein N [Aquibacillus rhizosphaerae]|uniref:Small, acid-soluble spore protein N n=1 Tax=Aquibacillus rhizosphaerae TaxID=3051431 RepID=A0ABT7L172_9BACI|nr:acid-soluble spore protein N [Aquibacillus sp. LR5S19]MDL4839549.1 acid-soluble spore protein N [Aquibacillus sp. LR5S19]